MQKGAFLLRNLHAKAELGAMTALWWSIAVVLLACQLTVGEWTFSLRISSARCGRAGPCDGNILAMCLRHIGAVREDRGHSCYVFIAGEANELLERELTSLDQVNSTLMPDGSPFVNPYFSYRGGVQLYMAILTQPDIPPFKEDIVDEVFVDLERTMGGGECSVVDVVGLEGILSATVSFTVDCYTGYSGDNCSCSGNETCESTGATSNCDTTPTSTSSESPPATNSDATSTATESTATPSPSGSEPSIEQPTVGALNSTEASETSLLLPVAAAGGGVVVILGVLILVVTIILVYRRRRYRKMYRLNLSALTVKSPKLTPTIPPNDVVDNNGVTYSTVVHEDNTGYHNEGYGEEKVDLSKLSKSQSGLVYADLDHNSNNAGPPAEPGVQYVQVDHDRATYSTFRASGHQKRKPPPPNTPIQYTTIRREQPHKYVNVPHPKPRSNLPRTEQNLYSTVPPDARIAPTNQ